MRLLIAATSFYLLLLSACASAVPPAAPTAAKPTAQPAPTQSAALPAGKPTLAPTAAPRKFPTRPVTLIVPWAAGGGTDRVARVVGSLLEKDFGQPVNVVNRTGGEGAVGHIAGSTAEPDGYTITLVTVEVAMMPWRGIAQVSPKGFAPTAQLNFDPSSVQVKGDAGWNDLKELLVDIKANQGKYQASGTGKGGIWDLARAGMLKTAGLPLDSMPWVPSEGAAPALEELVAGRVAVVTTSLPEGASLIEAKKVKPLAVMGEKRDPAFPNVPTLIEQGIDWSMGAWRGLALPRGARPETVAIYENALKKVYDSAEFQAFMKRNGFGLAWRDSRAFTVFMDQQEEAMGKIMKEIGLAR